MYSNNFNNNRYNIIINNNNIYNVNLLALGLALIKIDSTSSLIEQPIANFDVH